MIENDPEKSKGSNKGKHVFNEAEEHGPAISHALGGE
jgi:hypothetical protein